MTTEVFEKKDTSGAEVRKAKKCNKRVKRILLLSVIIFAISAVSVLLAELNSASINISAEFSELSNGKNPDGSAFDIHEVLCDEVLHSAVQKLDRRIDIDDIRAHLSISHNTYADDLGVSYQKIRDGVTEYMSVPSTYRLTYSTVTDKIRADGIFSVCGAFFKQFAMPSKKAVLTAVAESYAEYYANVYVQSGEVLETDWAKTDALDYYRRAEGLGNTLGMMMRFVHERYNDNADFISTEYGIGYGELYNDIRNIYDVDLNNYKSYVIKNGLTSDRASLLRQFRYMEAASHEENIRQTSRYEIIRAAVDMYDPDVTKVVFIPALDYEYYFYMNRTKVGMDYLVEDADAAKLSADAAKGSELRYQYLSDRFSSTVDATEAEYKQADEMYGDIKSKVDTFRAKAVEFVNEENSRDIRVRLVTGDAYSGIGIVSMAVQGAKLFITLSLITYLLAVVIDFVKSKKNADAR